MAYSLAEGEPYFLKARATNKSTLAGQPVSVTLRVVMTVTLANLTLRHSEQDIAFGPGTTELIEATFSVPWGMVGQPGNIAAKVFAPTGAQLAAIAAGFTVIQSPGGSLAGKVSDALSGQPIPGATVEAEGSPTPTTTNADGSYLITGVRPGTANDVAAVAEGYQAKTDLSVVIEAGVTTLLDIELTPLSPPAPDTIEITAINMPEPNWAPTIIDVSGAQEYAETIYHITQPVRLPRLAGTQIVLEYTSYWSGQNYGPYLVTLPDTVGKFIWDGAAKKMSGIASLDLAKTSNRSLVTGTLKSVDDQWVELHVEATEMVPGYTDVADLYLGQDIVVYGGVPLDDGNVIPQIGDRVTLEATMMAPTWGPLSYKWTGKNYHLARELPPEHYQFEGSLAGVCVDAWDGSPYGCYKANVSYSINGIAPGFAWRVRVVNYYATSGSSVRGFGPAQGVIPAGSNSNGKAYLYANPDPAAPAWSESSWKYNNWILVATLVIRDVRPLP